MGTGRAFPDPAFPRTPERAGGAVRGGCAGGSAAPASPAGRAQPRRGAVTSDASQSRSAGCAALRHRSLLPPTLRAPTLPASFLSGWLGGKALKAVGILPAPRSGSIPGAPAPHSPAARRPRRAPAARSATGRRAPGSPALALPAVPRPPSARGAAYIFCTGFRRLRLA